MIRVVLDTNVIVSALLKEEGNQAAVLLLALKERFRTDGREGLRCA
jgi:predicted nucleic acid-binding protein